MKNLEEKEIIFITKFQFTFTSFAHVLFISILKNNIWIYFTCTTQSTYMLKSNIYSNTFSLSRKQALDFIVRMLFKIVYFIYE